MASYLFATVALVFLWASPVNAEMWCDYGAGSTTLDHPCSGDNDRLHRAVAYFQAQRQWKKIPGVMDIGWGLSDRGDSVEIQVFVDPPSMIPPVAAQVPVSFDGVPIAVVANEVQVSTPKPTRGGPNEVVRGTEAERRVISVTINKGECYVVDSLRTDATPRAKVANNPNSLVVHTELPGQIVMVGADSGGWNCPDRYSVNPRTHCLRDRSVGVRGFVVVRSLDPCI